ncbi:MAG: M1 family metallopeptidase [Chlorobi bacterium]|nr:M1 family metallopeptidase [Chlorobiota bacterium]
MIIKWIPVFLSACLFSAYANAQNYFQQEVNYEIHVSLNDQNNSLKGNITIEYTNNSPDKLSFIYFHLWPNAYKNNNTALARQTITLGDLDFYYASDSVKGFIDSLNFKGNNELLKWEFDSENIDICKLILNNPLNPSETIKITTPFYIKIPSAKFSRFGHYGQNYNITQWFPKPAVYDQYGWHAFPYLDQGEFYSEYGSFNVFITLPVNYVVAATGNLQTEREKDWLNRKIDETENAIKKNKFRDSTPSSTNEMKTIHFYEKNIHDFAWWASKDFLVLNSKVELPRTKKTVHTYVYFKKQVAHSWKDATNYVNDALYYYSLWIGDYAYNNCSAVYSSYGTGGGMEYPTITAIGPTGNAKMLEEVIMHEVGHNWFYGMLGSNEREFPFLDEGINSAYEQRYLETKYPDYKLYEMLFNNDKIAKVFGVDNYPFRDMNYYGYLTSARKNIDQAISENSTDYSTINYLTIVYQKSALAFTYLRAFLGDSLYDAAMKDYFVNWKFKHPYPDNLESIFHNHTSKDLSWFFNDLLTTTKKIDYKISKVKNDSVLVKNKAKINSPVNLSGIKNNQITNTQWFEGFTGKKWLKFQTNSYDKIAIDYQQDIPEIKRTNNTFITHKLLKKTEPLALQFAGLIENPNKTQLNYFPAFGYNYYDKLMPGILLYNNLWPQKNFEFQLLPFYSFGNNMLAGNANFVYTFFPLQKYLQSAELKVTTEKYGSKSLIDKYYYKVKLQASFDIKKKHLNSPYFNKITLNTISVPYDLFYNLKYSFFNKNKLHPTGFSVNMQTTGKYLKSWIEANSKIHYKINKSIYLRFFAGKFLYQANQYYGNYNFRMSGLLGKQDYLYETIFLGREEDVREANKSTFLSRQFVESDGGFSIYSSLGQTNNWLISINSSIDVPFITPLKVYFNIATFDNAKSFLNNSGFVFYETGIKLSLINDIINVYFPISYSNEIKQNAELNNYYTNYAQKIRFSLSLNKINPFKLAKDFVYY